MATFENLRKVMILSLPSGETRAQAFWEMIHTWLKPWKTLGHLGWLSQLSGRLPVSAEVMISGFWDQASRQALCSVRSRLKRLSSSPSAPPPRLPSGPAHACPLSEINNLKEKKKTWKALSLGRPSPLCGWRCRPRWQSLMTGHRALKPGRAAGRRQEGQAGPGRGSGAPGRHPLGTQPAACTSPHPGLGLGSRFLFPSGPGSDQPKDAHLGGSLGLSSLLGHLS